MSTNCSLFSHQIPLIPSNKNIKEEYTFSDPIFKKWDEPQSHHPDLSEATSSLDFLTHSSRKASTPREARIVQGRLIVLSLDDRLHLEGMRDGYIAGLTEFVTIHEVPADEIVKPSAIMSPFIRNDNNPQAVKQAVSGRGAAAYKAFCAGLERKAPPTEWGCISTRSYEYCSSEYGFLLDRMLVENLQAWRLGFAVSICRDTGVVLRASEIPASQRNYNAFMRGYGVAVSDSPVTQTVSAVVPTYSFMPNQIIQNNIEIEDILGKIDRTTQSTGRRCYDALQARTAPQP